MTVEAIDQHIQAIQRSLKERSQPPNGLGERLPTAAAEELCAALEDLRRQSQDLFARQAAELAEVKQREATLRRREQELTDFVENAAMGLRWVGPDGTILWANSAELELLGYSKDEYVGHHLAEFHADKNVVDDILAKLTAGMTLPDYEARLLCKDGSIKHVLISSNVCWEDGKFIHSRCFTRDITDRKQAEAALRASEERLRTLIENNLDGIMLVGANGQSLYLSPSVTRILGYSDTELRGSGIRLDRVHRDDVARAIAFMAELVQHPRQAITTQYRFRHKDGSWRWIEAVANDLLGEPETNAIVVNFRDITQHAQAEEALRAAKARLQHVLASSPAVIYALKIEGDTFLPTWVSENVTRMLGYEVLEALATSWWIDHVHPDDRARVLSEQSLPFPNDRLLREYRLRHKDGTYRWIRDETRLLRDAAGQPVEAIGSWSDVTERKQAKQEIAARIRQQAAVADLGRLALEGADLSTLMNEAVARVAQTLQVEYCNLMELLPDGNALLLRAGIGWREGCVGHATVSAGLDSQAGYTLLADQPVIVEDLRTETRFNAPALLLDHGVVSGMSVSIRSSERPYGVLGAHTAQRRLFTPDDVYFLRSTANVLAAAIERKRAEEVLRQSEERFSTTFHASPIGISLTQLPGERFLDVNDSFLLQTGYSREEVVDHTSLELRLWVNREDRAEISQILTEGRPARSLEIKFRRKSGEIIETLASFARVEVAGQQCVLTLAHDITERKQAEASLRESEERYRRLVEVSPDAIVLTDLKANILMLNSRTLELFGYDNAQELIGQNSLDFIVPEDQPRAMQNLQRMLTAGSVRDIEYTVFKKDGTRFAIELSAALILNPQGEPHAFTAVLRDITARKQAERSLWAAQARIESVLSSVADVHILLDRQWRFLYVNPAAIRGIGRPREQILGRAVWELYPDIVGTELERQYRRAMDERLPVAFEFHYLTQDTWWDNRFYPVHQGLAIFATNITERKKAEEELRRQAARAEALAHTAARLNAVYDLHAVINAVCEETARALNVPIAAIYLASSQGDMLRCAAGYGLPPNWGERLKALPLAAYEVLVRREGPTRVIPDVQAILDLPNADLSIELDARTAATAAMQQEDRLIGFLGVFTIGSVREFAPDELSLLRSLADQAALAIEKAQLFEEVQDGQVRLRSLSRRLLDAQETERRYIARELHDEIGQTLTGLKLLIGMSAHLPANAAAPRLADAQSLIDDLMDLIHRLSLDLRPTMLDDLGLLPTLLSHTERYTAQTGVRVCFEHAGLERRFPQAIETAAYRIVQEALTNVARHAGVREVNVRVWADPDALYAQIEDKGAGFDADAVLASHTTSGLAGMRERATLLGGELTIDSTPGAGTRILAELPLGGQGQD